jgi:hypothetical protein
MTPALMVWASQYYQTILVVPTIIVFIVFEGAAWLGHATLQRRRSKRTRKG